MAATPQYGSMTFIGLRTKRTYTKDIYLSDVAGALINFDGGSGAGASSPDSWTPREPVVLLDYAQVTGTADTTKIQITRDGVPTGDILRYVPHLTTLNNRPKLRVPFGANAVIGAIQLA
jgi:hypothetical protein